MLTVQSLTGERKVFGRFFDLMGDRFGISVVGDDQTWSEERMEEAVTEIRRVKALLGADNAESALNIINNNAGIKPVKVNAEIFRLLQRALQISELTHGAFDVTYTVAPLVLRRGGKRKKELGGYKDLILDQSAQTVFLKSKGMRVSFDLISRGYVADRAKYILQMSGVSSGVINAGGDLLSWGAQPDNTPWTIAAADPSQANKPYADVNISNMAISTSFSLDQGGAEPSGLYADNVTANNGFEISKIRSVSVISPGAELADAMVSPIIAMGVNAGLYLVNKLNQIACIIVDDRQRVYTSKSIQLA